MDAANARRTLEQLALSSTEVQIDVGIARHEPRQFAYAKVMAPSDSSNHAVVWTPGDRWFNLDSSRGFGAFEIGEGLDDETVTQLLANYLDAATELVCGRATEAKSRIFRRPFLTVNTANGVLRLRRTSIRALKRDLALR